VARLLAETIPLALGAAISPVIFLLQLTTLTGPRPLVRGSALAIGAAVPLAIVGVIAVVTGGRVDFSGPDTVKGVVELALGVLLVGFGVRVLLRPPKPPSARPPAHSQGSGRSFVLGMLGMGTNVSTFALYIPAMAAILVADVDVAEQVVAAAIVVVISLSAVLLPLLLTAVVPDASRRLLARIGRWMTAHHRAITVVLSFGFGAYLVVKGASDTF